MENQKKIKVVHFSHWSRSGITSLIKTIAKNNQEYFSFILLESDPEFCYFYNEIPEKTELNFSKSIFYAIKKYIHFIKKMTPDIIHVHSLTPLLLATILSPNYKKIFHLHCDYPYLVDGDIKSKTKRLLMRLCLNRKNCTAVSVSESAKETLKNFLNIEAIYIANGVSDTGLIRPSFQVRKVSNRFYSVCRLDKEKRIIDAINLINDLAKSGHNVSYHIFGSGSERESLANHISMLGVEDKIELKGFSEAPENLPAEYDFYISTSIQEGLSLSALHALRGMTPLITTPIGQIGLVLKDSHDGFILQGNKNDHLEKLKKILFLSNDDLNDVQKNARALYLNHYTIDKFLLSIENLYRMVLKKG